MDTLITVQELERRTSAAERIVLLDVRWALGNPHGREHYRSAHLPGAVYVDLEAELCGPGGPGLGRHPLPAVEALQEAARRWGVDDGDTVVAYDATGNLAAARLWWLLRHAGVPSVRLLDGGLTAWRAAGFDVEDGEVANPAGNVTLSYGHLPVVSVEDLRQPRDGIMLSGTLLDARAGERFRGELEPVDPQAGHIPGAVSAPTTDNLREDARFRSADELRRRFADLGAEHGPVAVYCGSGITAAHQIAALEIAGIEAALYPGSWSQWSTTEGLPVAIGP